MGLRQAVDDVLAHRRAWIALLEAHIATLPPDRPETPETPGTTARGHAEHELKAMKRDLETLATTAAYKEP